MRTLFSNLKGRLFYALAFLMVAGGGAFAQEGGIQAFTGDELSGVPAVVGGFIAIGVAVAIGLKVFGMGKRAINRA